MYNINLIINTDAGNNYYVLAVQVWQQINFGTAKFFLQAMRIARNK
jgi:hypothetical protein